MNRRMQLLVCIALVANWMSITSWAQTAKGRDHQIQARERTTNQEMITLRKGYEAKLKEQKEQIDAVEQALRTIADGKVHKTLISHLAELQAQANDSQEIIRRLSSVTALDSHHSLRRAPSRIDSTPSESQEDQFKVEGKVIDQKGNGIPDAQVTVKNLTTKETFGGSTDIDGEFSFSALPGKYELTVSAKNFQGPRQRINLPLTAAQIEELKEITLEPSKARITGKVKNKLDEAIVSAAIELQDPANATKIAGRGVTDKDGKFNIANLPPSTYNIVVKATGYKVFTSTPQKLDPGKELSLKDDLVITKELRNDEGKVTPDDPAIVTGEVYDASSPPIKGLANATVQLQASNSSGGSINKLYTKSTDGKGKFTVYVPNGTYDMTVLCLNFKPFITQIMVSNGELKKLDPIRLEREGDGEFYRAIAGVEQIGANSSGTEQHTFLDLFFSRPIGRPGALRPNFRVWGDVRLTSVPQQIQSGVKDFVSSFASNAVGTKVNQIADAVVYMAGLQYRLPSDLKVGPTQFHFYAIAGGGATTTRSSVSGVTDIFKVPTKKDGKQDTDAVAMLLKRPEFCKRPETCRFTAGSFTGKEFIAFAAPDRDRFFRQYYGGVRFETKYFQTSRIDKFNPPAIFDVMVGQNETVTGGGLQGAVLRLDGFFPLPISADKDPSFIYLFGTAFMKLHRSSNFVDPLVLERATGQVAVPAENVLIVTSPPSARDYYRIGIGVNLLSIIDKLRTKSQTP